MAQDFAKRRQPEKKSGPRKKNTRAATRQNSTPDSHWSWFFTGLLAGFFIAFVAWLAMVSPGAPTPSLPAMGGGAQTGTGQDDGRTQFDFYEYLEEAEVMVDVVPVEERRRAPPPDDDVSYLLQAGSFQARDDAENRRARIMLMNLNARVVPGQVSGKTWHRVQVGPFEGRTAAEQARATLSSSNIDTIVLRLQ